KAEQAWALAVILLQPASIIIDHGHFQYNCISLALATAAVGAVVRGWDVVGSVLYCMAFNHKHMALYYAPAFFGHLFGKCLQRRRPVLQVLRLGVAVVGTCAVCWWPFLSSWEVAAQVLHRLVPLARGVFEDHVANFWCVSSVVIKWKQLIATSSMATVALVCTVAACLPAMVQQIRAPSTNGFLLALVNSSLGFYLFAFQVHEKNILLAALPVTLLALTEPELLRWFIPLVTFSMTPLLRREGLLIATGALLLLFAAMYPMLIASRASEPSFTRPQVVAGWTSFFVAVSVLVVQEVVEPPARYPYLYSTVIVAFSFVHIAAFAAYGNWRQWTMACSSRSKSE
ncbi:hypothetical protein CYMTET_13958, partial [Cymbomonas tetramitiformis]